MKTYLLTWNPKKWPWHDFDVDLQQYRREGYLDTRWSCGRSTAPQPHNRVFLLRQGQEPRGILASGYATSTVYEDEHWNKNSETHSPITRYIDVRLDVLLEPSPDTIFLRTWLDTPLLADAHWNTQMSGIRLPDHVAQELEVIWARFLAAHNIVQYQTVVEHFGIAERTEQYVYLEGAQSLARVTHIERNVAARRACIQHYGLRCVVCGFDFAQVYGEFGLGFIHIHHLVPISSSVTKHAVDPVKDLRPVCANCHAMLHKQTPPLTIEELQAIVKEARAEHPHNIAL